MLTPQVADNSEPVYETPRFTLRLMDLPKRGGGVQRRGLIATRDAVVIVPMLDEDTVVLIRNQRFAVDQQLWECPAGTIEDGEDPLDCAAREVQEETGYRAELLVPLNGFFACPGMVTEYLHVFLAADLTNVGQSLDETESIQVQPVKWDDAMAMIQDQTIRDAKTIASLLYVHSFLRGK